uniref:Uncharacterized protein n=1 Tax=Opuntia streptacantha TaxID=393608 RepID=A0A7C8YBH1_OPUST
MSLHSRNFEGLATSCRGLPTLTLPASSMRCPGNKRSSRYLRSAGLDILPIFTKSATNIAVLCGFKVLTGTARISSMTLYICKTERTGATITFPCMDEQIVDAKEIPAPMPTTLKRVDMASPFANRSLRFPSFANEEYKGNLVALAATTAIPFAKFPRPAI